MNDQDLRDCFAMFISVGMLMKYKELDPKMIWDMADAMLETRRVNEEPQGIVAIKKRRGVK
jgi:hypothetical protein